MRELRESNLRNRKRMPSEPDIRPSIVILNSQGDEINEEDCSNENNDNKMMSFSEMDPEMVMAASVFVQELIQRAQLEVETRFMIREDDDDFEQAEAQVN